MREKSDISGATDNMKSSQTNLGILSIGVEQSTNDCDCNSVWGTLEIIAAIALFFLVTYLLFRCISSYCKKRKARQEQKQWSIVELLENISIFMMISRSNSYLNCMKTVASFPKKLSQFHF